VIWCARHHPANTPTSIKNEKSCSGCVQSTKLQLETPPPRARPCHLPVKTLARQAGGRDEGSKEDYTGYLLNGCSWLCSQLPNKTLIIYLEMHARTGHAFHRQDHQTRHTFHKQNHWIRHAFHKQSHVATASIPARQDEPGICNTVRSQLRLTTLIECSFNYFIKHTEVINITIYCIMVHRIGLPRIFNNIQGMYVCIISFALLYNT